MASRKSWRFVYKIPGCTKTDPPTWPVELERRSCASHAAANGCSRRIYRRFCDIYREATRAICAEVNGEGAPQDLDFPTVEDGVKGMAFITAAVQSTKNGGVWTRLPGTN